MMTCRTPSQKFPPYVLDLWKSLAAFALVQKAARLIDGGTPGHMHHESSPRFLALGAFFPSALSTFRATLRECLPAPQA